MAGIIEIPRFALPSQQLQKLPTAILPTPRTSDTDFGGDIGRALSGAGDLLGDAVLEDAARRNEASARSIDTSFAGELRKLLHDPERGYYATKGRAAVDAYAPTYQAITALYDRHVAQAANPAQQQMARAVLDRRVRLASDGIAAHSVREDASWQSETRSARIDGAIADATLAWGDPAQLRLHYNTGLQEALASGAAVSDPVATDSERRSYATRFHAAVIGARVDADPEGARQYFEQNRAAMDPAAAAAFDARLALASERRRALGIADGAAPRDAGIVAFGPGPEPQRDDYVNRARTEAETLPEASPSLIRLTEAAAAKRHARDHAMWKQRRGDAINAAYEWADANPDASVAEIPMQVWSGLDPDTQTRVEGYVNAGGQVETDWQRYFELQDLAIENPGAFGDVNLVEEKPDIADRDLDVLGELQEVIRKGDPDSELVRLRAAKETFDDAVNSVGVASVDPAAIDLRRRFQMDLVASARDKDRDIEPRHMQRVLDRLVATVGPHARGGEADVVSWFATTEEMRGPAAPDVRLVFGDDTNRPVPFLGGAVRAQIHRAINTNKILIRGLETQIQRQVERLNDYRADPSANGPQIEQLEKEIRRLRAEIDNAQARIDALDAGLEAAESSADSGAPGLSPRAARRALNRAMMSAGIEKPPGTHAHHIVAYDDPRADFARDILQKFGIDVNGAENGVFLPGAYHAALHTDAYHETIEFLLRKAKTREEAIRALDTVRQTLLKGVFPR